MSFKITLFYRGIDYGGIERFVVVLANQLSKQGHTADLLLYKADGPFRASVDSSVNIIELGITPFKYISGFVSIRAIFAVTRYLASEKPDLFISSGHFCNEVSLIAKKLSSTNSKVVIVEHTATMSDAKTSTFRLWRAIPLFMKLLYRFADEFVVVSSSLIESVKGIPLKKNKFPIAIPNGVLIQEVQRLSKEAVTDSWFLEDDTPIALAVGRLVEQKNHALLIKAFASVSKKTNARLVIIGSGKLHSKLTNLIEELSLTDKAKILPFDPNPYKYMSKSKVFVLSSNVEGSPLALIEALACGANAISSDCCSGPREVLQDELFGYLFPVGDQEKLEKLLEKALADELPKKPLNEKWFQRWDVSTMAESYLELLRADSKDTELTEYAPCQ